MGGEGVHHPRDRLRDRASGNDVLGVGGDEGGGTKWENGNERVCGAAPADGLNMGARQRNRAEAGGLTPGAAREREVRHRVEGDCERAGARIGVFGSLATTGRRRDDGRNVGGKRARVAEATTLDATPLARSAMRRKHGGLEDVRVGTGGVKGSG